jgi:hypothetical protein
MPLNGAKRLSDSFPSDTSAYWIEFGDELMHVFAALVGQDGRMIRTHEMDLSNTC